MTAFPISSDSTDTDLRNNQGEEYRFHAAIERKSVRASRFMLQTVPDCTSFAYMETKTKFRQVRLEESVALAVASAAKRDRRSFQGQLDYILRLVFGRDLNHKKTK